jgi:hypothetical protein
MQLVSCATPEEAHRLFGLHGVTSFPVDMRTKKPVSKGWREAPQLDVWPRSGSGIAMATGWQGLVVVDLDGDCDAIIHELALQGLSLPETMTWTTPSGGLHLWYAGEPGMPNKNPLIQLAELPAIEGRQQHIDTRGLGGYVVCPPGKGRGPAITGPVAALPDWIVELYQPQQRTTAIRPVARPRGAGLDGRVRAYLLRADPAIEGSGGHNQTLRVATALAVGFDLSDAAALDYMLDWNRTCQPPWDRDDLERKISEARRCSTRQPGYLLTQRAGHEEPCSAQTWPTTEAPAPVADAVPVGASVEWWWNPVTAPWTQRERIVRERYAPRRNLLTQRTELPSGEVIDKFVVRRIVCELEALQPAWVPDLGAKEGQRPARREDGRIVADDVLAALDTAGAAAPWNPVISYLDGLPAWDGVDHAKSLARTLADREDEWEATALRLWLLGAVWRAYAPGCKMDLCLWLYGPEGSGKSTLGPALVPCREWSSELKPSQMRGQFAFLSYHQAWLLELSEADQHRRDMEAFKAFITTAVDSGQLKNENLTEFRARSFVCYATTNALTLEGDSAERRLLPVYVGGRGKWRAISTEFRDQLWAQAVAGYRAGVQPTLPDEQSYEQHRMRIRELQDADDDGQADPYLSLLKGWRTTLLQGATVPEVMELLAIPRTQWTDKRTQMALAKSLRRLGCERRRVWQRGWVWTLCENT